MKYVFFALTALALISGSASASEPGCITNWVGGACGVPKSDASHHANVYDSGNKPSEPDCPEKDGKTS